MKFLSKLAQIFAKGLQIVGLFGPSIQTLIPQSGGVIQTVSADLAQIGNVIVDVEQMSVALQLKGPDKLKAAAPLVADVILRSTLVANHKIDNQDLFNQGVMSVASGMADILNSFHSDGTQVTDKKA